MGLFLFLLWIYTYVHIYEQYLKANLWLKFLYVWLLMQCLDTGRPSSVSNDVLSVQEVIQIGEDPILILDGTV